MKRDRFCLGRYRTHPWKYTSRTPKPRQQWQSEQVVLSFHWVHRLLGQARGQVLPFTNRRVGWHTPQTIGQGRYVSYLPQHRLGQGLHLAECRQGMNPKGCRWLGQYPSCPLDSKSLDRLPSCLVVPWRLECRLQPLRGRVISRAFVVVVFLIDKSSSRARANIKFCRWDRKICLDLLSKAGKNYGF